MIRSGAVLFAALAMLGAARVPARAAAPEGCTAAGALPAELAAWARPHARISAAAKAAGLDTATLTVGTAVDAALQPTPDVDFPNDPAKPGGSVSHGGLFVFEVAEAGSYRVALGSGAWVDVIEQGKAALSTAHGHGPDCTGIRKMVDYALQPGRHMLQVSANGEPTLSLMITKLP